MQREQTHWSGQGKHLAFPFARGWVGRINQQCTATRVLVYTEVRKAQSKEDPPALLAVHQTHSQWGPGDTAAFLGSTTEQQFPGFSLPSCSSPALEQHRKSNAVAISWFLFTTRRSRAPAIDYHVFRVICKARFLSLYFLLWGFSPYMPSGRALIFRLPYTAELLP